MKKIILTCLFISASVFSLKAQVTGLSGWNIYVDPGHSQTENVGVYGYSEAHKVLRVGLALRDYLLNETDIDTVYISRTNDQQSVSLNQRTDHANSLGAAWFHSIHSDASSNQATNSTLLLHGGWRENGMTVEKTPNGGKAMSDIMIEILTRGMRTNTRGNYADRTFYEGFPDNHANKFPYLSVNRRSTMPSELSEAGFHTSTVQNPRNMNADWKKLEAKTLYWTILKYHNLQRPHVGIATGIISDKESGVPVNGAQVSIGGKTYTTDTYQSLFHSYSNDSTQLHNGFYYVEDLPADSFQVIVSAPDYLADTSFVIISDTFFTFKDMQLVSTILPAVTSFFPAQNDSIYPGKEDVVFNFNRTMNKASVESSLVITPAAPIGFTWGNSNKTLIISTDSLAYSQEYKLEILPTATDLYGNLFDGNGDRIGGDTLTLNFSTKQLDQDPPIITALYPTVNQGVELRPIIRVNFNEELKVTGITSFLKLVKASDQSLVGGLVRHNVVNGKSVVHFFPTAELKPMENHQFKILAGIKDLLDNMISADSVINFQTGNTGYNVISIDNFDAGIASWWQPGTSGTTGGLISSEAVENNSVTNILSGSTTSMQINYKWDPAASSWMLREYLNSGAPRDVLFDKSYLMQVYVFGDGSNNKFRFAVDDRVPPGSTHEVSQWYTIDWIGWKLISWDMNNDPVGTWIGDGTLDGTLRFDSFQITYDQAAGAREGSIYLDDFRLAKTFIVTSTEDESSITPSKFALFQNYPNPFNPTTIIKYQVPVESFITVKVYDILGKEVAELVNGQKSAGTYKIEFEAAQYNLSSGIYFYTLSSESFSSTKKLILLK